MGVVMFSIAALASAPLVQAQNENDPSARVARISYLQGSVSLQLAHSDDWLEARINRPMTNRDQIWTAGGARAELQIGMATIRLDQNTQLGMLELSDNVLQIQLNQGVLNINVRGLDDDDTVEVDTPNSSITFPEPGNYRVEVGEHDDLTIVQVRDGTAEVAGERQHYSVRENEQLRLRGTGRLNAQFDDLERMDEFDRWVAARNSRARNATAASYVDVNVVGYEDLDDYGYWSWESGFGNVWHPNRVVRGWSPYRYGHWEWIAPWGWTWMDDAPWGFAPFHYGRWAEVHHHWCWVPGRREVRAVYAPALVAWVGTPGLSISVNVNSGPVGWIPLGPREIFRPHYHASDVYLSRVNVGNSLLNREELDREFRRDRRDQIFVNRHAASVVGASAFISAGNVNRNLMPVEAKLLNPVDTLERLRPDRPSFSGNARVVSAPPQIIDREVMVQRRPAPFVPQPGWSPQRNVNVGGSVRVIEPNFRRRDIGSDRDNAAGGDRRISTPVDRDPPTDQKRDDRQRFDRWGRNGNQIENRVEQHNDVNDTNRRDWRNRPPEHQDVAEPATDRNRINPPPQGQPSEPERRRIGPWVHDEQRLRPEPAPQQRQVQPPPVNPPPAPRIEPSRATTPPPQNSPPANNRGEEERHPPGRREIR